MQKGIICRAIGDLVNTSAIRADDMADTNSESAGTGYAVEAGHGLSRVERGRGVQRGYLLINTAGEREDTAEFMLWDWPGDIKAIRITDSEGKTIPYQVLDDGRYWDHEKKGFARSLPRAYHGLAAHYSR